jgi:predicted GIY-YIG superfamily endonuclease
METWHVYQLRSDTELLYVGYTRQPLKRRFGDHRRTKPWWPEITQTQSEQFGTEEAARLREKEIWATEQPKYNKVSPFLTTEERVAKARERVRLWMRAHPERRREYERKYNADPANRVAIRGNSRAWARRNRPTTVTGRRSGRWRQSGPGLF